METIKKLKTWEEMRKEKGFKDVGDNENPIDKVNRLIHTQEIGRKK